MVVFAKPAIMAVAAKALTMGVLLYFVLTSHLTDFEKALIIAGVSAIITGLFTLAAAFLAVKFAGPTIVKVEDLQRDIDDVKGHIGASRRKGDKRKESKK